MHSSLGDRSRLMNADVWAADWAKERLHELRAEILREQHE